MPGAVDLSDLMEPEATGTATRSVAGDTVPPPPTPPAQERKAGVKVRSDADFSALMDKTFGAGKWKLTGDYRSPKRENELREEGAGTVPPGHVSAHSLGTPDAPGARDVIVPGMSPDEVAEKLKKSGAQFRHFFPEGAHGTQGAHLHIDMNLQPDPVDLSDLIDKKPTPLAQARAEVPQLRQGRSPVGEAVNQAEHAAGAALDAPGLGKRVLRDAEVGPLGLIAAGGDVGNSLMAAVTAGGKKLVEPLFGERPDAMAEQAAVQTNKAHPFPLDPSHVATPEDKAGAAVDIAETVVPAGAELAADRAAAKAAGMTLEAFKASKLAHPVNALKAAVKRPAEEAVPDTHLDDVRLLHDEGIRMTPGQIRGGAARDIESKRTSDPHVGHAIHEGVRQSINDFDRVIYRKTLNLAGADYPKDGDVGHDGIGAVYNQLSNAYEKLKPQMKALPDKEFQGDLTEAMETSGVKGSRERAELQSLIDRRIKPAFGKDGMTGEDFKTLESSLSAEAREYKNSGDAYQRKLGNAISEVLSGLQGSLERNSAPEVRPQLQKLNSAYASYKTMEDAAYAARSADGVFTPRQYATALGKGGRRQRAMVARGLGRFQNLARAAQRILPDKVPDSGTAGRSAVTRGVGAMTGAAIGSHAGPIGAGVGAAVGSFADRAAAPATNALARMYLERSAAKQLERRGIGQNALKGMVSPPPQLGPPQP